MTGATTQLLWRRLCLRWLPRPSQRRGCGKWIDVTDGFGTGIGLDKSCARKGALPSRAWRRPCKTTQVWDAQISRLNSSCMLAFRRPVGVFLVASQTLPKATTRGLARSFDGEPCPQMGMSFFEGTPFSGQPFSMVLQENYKESTHSVFWWGGSPVLRQSQDVRRREIRCCLS